MQQWHDRPLLSSEWTDRRTVEALPCFLRGIGPKVEEQRSNNTTSSELSSGRGGDDGGEEARVGLGEPETPQSAISPFPTPLACLRAKNVSINLPGAARHPLKSNPLLLGMRATPICGSFLITDNVRKSYSCFFASLLKIL